MKNYVMIILVLILVGGGAYFLFTKYGASQAPNTLNNATSEIMQKPTKSATPSATVTSDLVTLTANGFEPATLTIKVGDTVTWENKSGEEGNVSSDPHPAHTNYPPLNLGGFADGAKLTLTFDKAGSFGYHNHLNAEETGKIEVK